MIVRHNADPDGPVADTPVTVAAGRGGSCTPDTPRDGFGRIRSYLERGPRGLLEAEVDLIVPELTPARSKSGMTGLATLAVTSRSQAFTATTGNAKALAARLARLTLPFRGSSETPLWCGSDVSRETAAAPDPASAPGACFITAPVVRGLLVRGNPDPSLRSAASGTCGKRRTEGATPTAGGNSHNEEPPHRISPMRGFCRTNPAVASDCPLCARGDLNPHVPKDTGT